MSRIVTFKGKLNMGTQEKLHLSTRDGLIGYRIRKFQVISSTPGAANAEMVGKIYVDDQEGSIGPAVDFSETDLLAVSFYQDGDADRFNVQAENTTVIFDQETFNQDIFVTIDDAASNTTPGNYYIELEQFKIDLNSSTYHTLKNIRSKTQ